MKIHNRKELKTRRKNLRNYSTSAESTLWLLLKGKQLDGRKFRRQHSIGPYVVDFYCPEEKLVIELDGEHHFTNEGKRWDDTRAEYIGSVGISIIRFENFEVFDRPHVVLEEIRRRFTR